MEVPKVRTPLLEVDVAVALRKGHVLALGEPCGRKRLACAWAQVALENRRGEALDQYCIGNVTAGRGWNGDYFVLHVAERTKKLEIDGEDVWKNMDLKFRSYGAQDQPSSQRAAAGAAGYFSLMSGRYISCLKLFDVGEVEKAAFELGRLNYFTAKPAPYATAMASFVKYFERVIEPHMPEPTRPEQPDKSKIGIDAAGEARSILTDADIAAEIAVFQEHFPEFVRNVLEEEEAQYRREFAQGLHD
jgi:hypothetical protein